MDKGPQNERTRVFIQRHTTDTDEEDNDLERRLGIEQPGMWDSDVYDWKRTAHQHPRNARKKR